MKWASPMKYSPKSNIKEKIRSGNRPDFNILNVALAPLLLIFEKNTSYALGRTSYRRYFICRRHTSLFFPVKRRIDAVIVVAVQMAADLGERFAEALEVHDLPLPQELDGIPHVRVFDQPQKVIIGGPRLLLCAHILKKVGNGVALGLECYCAKGHTAGGLGPDPGGMVGIIIGKALGLDLIRRKPFQ